MSFWLQLAAVASVYVVAALGLQWSAGQVRLLSVAQCSFMAIGAYAVALLTPRGVPSLVAVIAGCTTAAAVAWLFARATVALTGDYFLMASIGLASVVQTLATNLDGLTGGPEGIVGVPRLLGLEGELAFGIVCTACAAAAAFGTRHLVNGSFGQVLRAAGDDADALGALGWDPRRVQVVASVFSAVYGAAAGSMLASLLRFIDPSMFGIEVGIAVLAMVILGGLDRPLRIALAAACLATLPELARFAGASGPTVAEFRQILIGSLLVAVTVLAWRPRVE